MQFSSQFSMLMQKENKVENVNIYWSCYMCILVLCDTYVIRAEATLYLSDSYYTLYYTTCYPLIHFTYFCTHVCKLHFLRISLFSHASIRESMCAGRCLLCVVCSQHWHYISHTWGVPSQSSSGHILSPSIWPGLLLPLFTLILAVIIYCTIRCAKRWASFSHLEVISLVYIGFCSVLLLVLILCDCMPTILIYVNIFMSKISIYFYFASAACKGESCNM